MTTYFPREEYENRWSRVEAEMVRRGYDALIVWQRSAGGYDRVGDVYWLTNFTTTGTGQDAADEAFGAGYTFSAAVFRRGRAPELHIGQPKAETDVDRIFCGELFAHAGDWLDASAGNWLGGLADHLKASGVEGKVAVVGSDILPALYERGFRARATGIDWVGEDDLLRSVQKIKSPRELEAFRTAGEIVTDALTAMMEALAVGRTGAEAASQAAAIIVKAGGGFHRIDVMHGPDSERFPLPNNFYGYDCTAPKRGDIVRGWIFGPIFQGYWLDPGRTLVCGRKPDAKQRALIEGANSIVEGIISEAKPGVTRRQLGVIGARLAHEVGYYDCVQRVPVFGHGLGSWFDPEIIPVGDPGPNADPGMKYDEPLREGMILAVEAFLTHKGVGMAGFEQNLIVTRGGTELLTRTPMAFL